ncbi:MAG TPA: hypothetical protein VGO58_16525 [Chitinophagaceae bacterium]|jgi:hypothetical protein|nr:hypothetical protein [Chitinophagaceae bacterium]
MKTNPLLSVVEPEVLNENKMTINSFLKQSYDHAKKGLEDGVNLIQDGVSFIKDEFSSFYHSPAQYLNKMVLPVNNFLKDLTQIETELQQEISKESPQLISLNGVMVPVEHALSIPMEENY